MYFQVISEYCRSHHQIKPFSHIVMDLFKEVIGNENYNQKINRNRQIKDFEKEVKYTEEQK